MRLVSLREALLLANDFWRRGGKLKWQSRIRRHLEVVREDQYGRMIIFGTQDPYGSSEYAKQVRKGVIKSCDVTWAWRCRGFNPRDRKEYRDYLMYCVKGHIHICKQYANKISVKLLVPPVQQELELYHITTKEAV